MINDLAVTDVHSSDGLHLFFRQCKIENVQIFCHPLLLDGLGDGGNIPLEMPAEDDLGCGFAVPAGDFGQGLMVENVFLRLGKGAPCLGDHTVVRMTRRAVCC